MIAKNFILAGIAVATALVGVAAPAGASVRSYRAEAHDSRAVTLYVRSNSTVVVRGDTDTDLDFVIYDADGDVVHSDYDYTDWTAAGLRPGVYTLEVSNLGDVYNAFTVDVDGMSE